MKRLALALAALLVAGPALAIAPGRALIVKPDLQYGRAPVTPDYDDYACGMVQQVLDELGVRYKVARPFELKTSLVKRGMVEGIADSFDVVIDINQINGGMDHGAGEPATYDSDSTGRTGAALGLYCTVPRIVLCPSVISLNNADDSLGFNTEITANGARDTTFSAFMPGAPWRWKISNARMFTAGTTASTKTLRTIVGYSNGYATGGWQANPDSIFAHATVQPDTALLWMVWAHTITGAKPIWSMTFGTGSRAGNLTLLAAALAHADSFAGHRILGDPGDNPRLPRKIAYVAKGLCERRAFLGGAGFGQDGLVGVDATTDSAAFKAGAGDSLRVFGQAIGLTGTPIVWFVDLDSMDAHPRDMRWAMLNPAARFAPMVRAGITGYSWSEGASTVTGFRYPRDPMGIVRSRFAFGDGSCIGKDSSLVCIVAGAYQRLWQKLKALGVPDPDQRISRSWWPHAYDWIGTTWATMTPDSVYSALAAGGVKVGLLNYDVGANRTLLPFVQQRDIRVKYGSREGSTIRFLSSWGGNTTSASSRQVNAGITYTYLAQDNLFAGLSSVYYTTGNRWVGQRASILMLDAANFGRAYDVQDTPMNPSGWHQIKWAGGSINAINQLAGRVIARLAYPEEVAP